MNNIKHFFINLAIKDLVGSGDNKFKKLLIKERDSKKSFEGFVRAEHWASVKGEFLKAHQTGTTLALRVSNPEALDAQPEEFTKADGTKVMNNPVLFLTMPQSEADFE